MIDGRQHMCTTRMSDDPRTGVVDAACRVHGVSNLYIGGSSVFGTPGYAKPTFTIVQLALRLGQDIGLTLGDLNRRWRTGAGRWLGPTGSASMRFWGAGDDRCGILGGGALALARAAARRSGPGSRPIASWSLPSPPAS